MRKTENLIGKRFGRLRAIEHKGRRADGREQYLCKCDCGREIVVIAKNLKNNNTKSCGCLKRDSWLAANVTHGKSKTKLYRVWASIKDRCYRSGCKNYHNYGGRGIAMCDEWKDSFQSFYEWATSNGYSPGLTIERMDVDGNYTPDNCCWITAHEQCQNKRNTRRITLNGECHTFKEWAEITGVNYYTLFSRYQAGKPPEEILKERIETNVLQ